MDQHIICIVAGQRAGTTALQQVIERSGVAANCGEIFQQKSRNARESRWSFPDFAREKEIALADVMQTAEARAVTRRYFSWLRQMARPRHVLIDVKLNSWFALSPAWQYPHEAPFLLKHLKRERAIFVYIWRESLADQVLSIFISQEFGIWHNLDADKVAGRRIEAPIARLERLAKLICRSEADMHEHLGGYSKKIVIRYEDLYRDGVLTEGFKADFRSLVGAELPNGQVIGIRPNSANKRDIISNYDEAVSALAAVAAKHRPGPG